MVKCGNIEKTQEEKREDEGKDGIVRSDRVEGGEEMEQGKRKGMKG